VVQCPFPTCEFVERRHTAIVRGRIP
jgi:hypothetical protein